MTNSAAMMHLKHLRSAAGPHLAGLASLVPVAWWSDGEGGRGGVPPAVLREVSQLQPGRVRSRLFEHSGLRRQGTLRPQPGTTSTSAPPATTTSFTTRKNDINALDCSSALFQAGDISQLPASLQEVLSERALEARRGGRTQLGSARRSCRGVVVLTNRAGPEGLAPPSFLAATVPVWGGAIVAARCGPPPRGSRTRAPDELALRAA